MDESTAKIRAEVKAELEEEYKARHIKEIAEFKTKLDEQNEQIIANEVERIRKELAPPTDEDLEKLLSQEYSEFYVTLPFNGGKKSFTIQELPQSLETELFKIVAKHIKPNASKLQTITSELLEGKIEDKVKALLDLFPEMLEIIAECCVIVLNPRGEIEELDVDWCKNNLSSTRMMNLIKAQEKANRMRDFFLSASQSFLGTTTSL